MLDFFCIGLNLIFHRLNKFLFLIIIKGNLMSEKRNHISTSGNVLNDLKFLFERKVFVLLGGLVLFLVILFMPLPEGMTISGKRLLAIVALMACWWIGEGTAIAVTALLPLVLFPLMGIMSSKQVAPNYANHFVFLFLGGFMIALTMEKWGFHKRIALWIITLVGTGLNRIVLGFMTAAAFLSMWISNTATTMMLLPVGMAVVRQIAEESTLDGNKNETTKKQITKSLGLILMLGLAYSASIGGVGTLIGTAPNIVFAGFYKNLYPGNEEISFVKWMMMAVPIVILFIPIVWIYLCQFVAPISLDRIAFAKEGKDIIKNELKALGKITRPEKMVAYVFVLTALMWIFRKPLPLGSFIIPGWSNLFSNPGMLHDSTVAMIMGILLMLLPIGLKKGEVSNIQGEYFLLDWNTVETRMPWGILLLFGGGFALASGFIKTGLTGWVGDQMSGLSVLPLWAVILAVCLVVTFLTEFTSNTATSTMILPLMGAAAVAASFHPLMFMLPATLSASFAFMLPVATPPNAIVFGSGWVTIPEMTRAGFILNLIGATLITSLALLLIQSFML